MAILLLVPERANCPLLFRQLAQFFEARLISCEDGVSAVETPVEIILADLRTTSEAVIACLRSILDAAGDIPRVGLVNIAKRQERVQAKALGFSQLWNTDFGIEDALGLMKPLIGDYSRPDLSADTPAATRLSIERLCATLDRISLSVMTEAQLPITQMAEAVQLSLGAIQSDGIGEWMSAVQGHHSHTFCHSMMVTGYTIAFAKLLGASDRTKADRALQA